MKTTKPKGAGRVAGKVMWADRTEYEDDSNVDCVLWRARPFPFQSLPKETVKLLTLPLDDLPALTGRVAQVLVAIHSTPTQKADAVLRALGVKGEKT
jgi:hypothetical protein